MLWIPLVILALLLGFAGGAWALRRWAHRLGERARRQGVLDEFDAGLAIPMRDSDTRRPAQRPLWPRSR